MGKTKSINYFAILIFTVLLSVCSGNDENAVSVSEFATLVERNECLLIDVRSPDEYLSGHIDGSATIDFYSPEFEHKFRFIDVNQCILLYCSTGNRSGQATHLLSQELGFTNIIHLKDGLNAWNNAGYKLVED